MQHPRSVLCQRQDCDGRMPLLTLGHLGGQNGESGDPHHCSSVLPVVCNRKTMYFLGGTGSHHVAQLRLALNSSISLLQAPRSKWWDRCITIK
jgi:hypothetical protein